MYEEKYVKNSLMGAAFQLHACMESAGSDSSVRLRPQENMQCAWKTRNKWMLRKEILPISSTLGENQNI